MKIGRLCIRTYEPLEADQSHLFRGFITNRFQYEEVTNYDKNNKVIYRYPEVQFKVINGIATIIALGGGLEYIKEIFAKLGDEIVIANKYLRIQNITVEVSNENLALEENIQQYQFITPWIALNQKIYGLYKRANSKEKKQILQDSLYRSLRLLFTTYYKDTETPIHVRIHNLEKYEVVLKGVNVNGYIGSWETNLAIPHLLGLGKAAARGYGCVLQK